MRIPVFFADIVAIIAGHVKLTAFQDNRTDFRSALIQEVFGNLRTRILSGN